MYKRQLDARVVPLNAAPDPRMSARDWEPSESSLQVLAEVVRASGAGLGVAHDGDADRVAVLDERGRWVPAEHLLILLARRLKARTVAVPINASAVLRDALPGVEFRYTPVGDVHVSHALRRDRLDLGGEPSGTFVLPRWSLCPDAPYAAAVVARIVQEEGPLSSLLGALPAYANVSAKLPVADGAREAAMGRVAAEVRGLGGTVTELDGIRADFEDGWLLVRASGTEPVVRVTAESRQRARAEALLEQGKRLVARHANAEARP